MNTQLTSNAEALRLFFTDDVYLVNDQTQSITAEPVIITNRKVEDTTIVAPVAQVEQVTPVLSIVEEPKLVFEKKVEFEYLGKNQKRILILVNDNTNKVSSVQGTELLRKLVKAIELTNNDFALVNYANYTNASFEDLKSFFKCELILSFGVAMRTLGLAEQPLHQLFVVDNVKFVFTKNLHDLDSDQVSKKILWGSLQQLK